MSVKERLVGDVENGTEAATAKLGKPVIEVIRDARLMLAPGEGMDKTFE